MAQLFASFVDSSAAERAAGALMDNGAIRADISIVANEGSAIARSRSAYEAADAEASAKEGFSTTTPADVAVGAMKGAAAGAGIGLAAALAALFVPGIGWVLGGGALATALAAAAGSAAAGTAAGGVVGYLKDQGISEEYVTKYSDTLYQGGAVLAVNVPSGDLSAAEAEGVLAKYGAINVGTFYAQQQVASTPVVPVAPVQTVPTVPEPVVTSLPATVPATTPVAVTPAATPVAVPVEPVTPVGGQPSVANGVPLVQPVQSTIPTPAGQQVVVAESTQTNDPLAPSTMVLVDPVSGVRRSVTTDPVTGLQTSAVVDPVTGEAIPATVVTVQTQGANAVEHQSVTGAIPGTPVVAAPGITEASVVTAPVVQHNVAVDASGKVIGETDAVTEQTVVVDPNRAKLL